jgi:hypothetical protein
MNCAPLAVARNPTPGSGRNTLSPYHFPTPVLTLQIGSGRSTAWSFNKQAVLGQRSSQLGSLKPLELFFSAGSGVG